MPARCIRMQGGTTTELHMHICVYIDIYVFIYAYFHPSECILNMLPAKPGVVPLHSIVRYLYEKLQVFSRICNIYTDIEEYLLWVVRFAGTFRH